MRVLPGSYALALLLLGCSNTTNPAPNSPSSMSFFPVEAADNPPPPDAAKTTLQPEDAARERDTLRAEDGRVLCVLPCTAWIRPEARLHVQVDRGESSGRVEVPFAEAASETVLVEAQRGHPNIAPWLMVGALLPLSLGSFTLALCKEGNDTPPGQDSSGLLANCVPGVIAASIGIAMLATGVGFAVTGRHPKVEVVERSAEHGSTSGVRIAPAGMGLTF